MKIKMLKSERGSQDGMLVENFKEGEIYDVVENLARVFVDVMNIAMFVADEPVQVVPVEQKMAEAPENKMADVDEVDNKAFKRGKK
jgi:hypothetical protein